MGPIGATELIVIALIAILLFGANRIADVGKGLGQGIKNFKAGLKDEDEKKSETPKLAEKSSDAGDAKEAKPKES
ncbi:MAG: twin-arginine translocase TatA/TatE family subunit [Polyangiaceae bacterium]